MQNLMKAVPGATLAIAVCLLGVGSTIGNAQPNAPSLPAKTSSPKALLQWVHFRSYVSDRPDLSGVTDRDDIRYIKTRGRSFLPRLGARGTTPPLRRVAAVIYPSSGLLIEYSAGPQALRWLLHRGRKSERSAKSILTELLRTGSITETAGLGPKVDGCTTGFNFIQHYPFDRLRNWPPNEAQLQRMIVVRMQTPTRSVGIPAGTFYYHFIDPVARRGFVVAN